MEKTLHLRPGIQIKLCSVQNPFNVNNIVVFTAKYDIQIFWLSDIVVFTAKYDIQIFWHSDIVVFSAKFMEGIKRG